MELLGPATWVATLAIVFGGIVDLRRSWLRGDDEARHGRPRPFRRRTGRWMVASVALVVAAGWVSKATTVRYSDEEVGRAAGVLALGAERWRDDVTPPDPERILATTRDRGEVLVGRC